MCKDTKSRKFRCSVLVLIPMFSNGSGFYWLLLNRIPTGSSELPSNSTAPWVTTL